MKFAAGVAWLLLTWVIKGELREGIEYTAVDFLCVYIGVWLCCKVWFGMAPCRVRESGEVVACSPHEGRTRVVINTFYFLYVCVRAICHR